MQKTAATKQGWYRRRGKRLADAVVAIVLLVVLSPIVLATATCVWVALGRPVLFRQERAGKDGRSFTLVKFRSMLPQTDVDGHALEPDARLTGFGRFLRGTSLDELPELWNVIRGEMSLVGPRPLLLRYNDRYSVEQARRLDVRPGITGWAQVHGRNDTTWSDRLDRDVWYVDHVSPTTDLLILLKTVPAVLRARGVTPPDEAFMPEFMGDDSDGVSNNRMTS